MLKKSAIKRIIVSSLALVIMLIICLFPSQDNLAISEEVIYVEELTMPIYVLDQNSYVARASVIKNKEDEDEIKYVIDALTIGSTIANYLPSGFVAILPRNTQLIDYTLEDKLLKLNFTKEFLDISKENEEAMIESLVFSLCELDGVAKIMIYVENSLLEALPHSGKKLPAVLDRNFGVNKIYNVNTIKDTSMTTTYYIGKYNDNLYYIPISKITNQTIEPVEIIVSELKSAPIYETNLISYLNASYELKDYEVLEDSITISFNNELLAGLSDADMSEQVKYSLALSLRDTYDIEDIVINID